MKNSFKKIIQGYSEFRDKYAHGDKSIMHYLSQHGQKPKIMVVACCDSRVDPALIMQCDPGDLFVTRNVANIVPPYEKDEKHHGTSAALEFAICYLDVEHLILLGHSQCGGIQALLEETPLHSDDFISNWVSLLNKHEHEHEKYNADDYAKLALQKSQQNCLTFPWIKEKIAQNKLVIHLWFFDIKSGQIFTYNETTKGYVPLA